MSGKKLKTDKSKRGRFVKKSVISSSTESVFSWHERNGAIERLSPPWNPIKVIHKSGGIQPGAKVVLGMKGLVRYRWHAIHTDYEKNRLFRDEQTRGPLSRWIHTHRFESIGDNQCILEDSIEYKPFLSFISQYLADQSIQKKLNRIFTYRHNTTIADVDLHKKFQHLPRKKILISGASGLLGQRLIPLLLTGNHTVLSLVRRQPKADNEIFWDPLKGILDIDKLKGIDAVIHLSGENVGEGRWTQKKKQRILESRLLSTHLLSEAVSTMSQGPEVFISASATGYYGDCGSRTVTEKSNPGDNFLASVCQQWEEAAKPALSKGIRTVSMRLGVVITPEGGALKKLLLPYLLGLGGRIGSGKQYLSWIGIDDALAAFYHTLMNDQVSGPVNVVSPEPVSQTDFSKTMASVLSRPAVFPLPAFLIKLIFGQMGEEGLLYSTKAIPEQLLDTGFLFRHSTLREALKHVLGK